MKKLRLILQYNYFYYILLFINIVYIIIYVNNYEINCNYKINEKEFILTISDIKIDGNKLSLEFKEDLVGTYYFESNEDKNNFNYELGDKLRVIGSLKIPSNNTIPNGFNYKEYLEKKGIKYILNIDKLSLENKHKNKCCCFFH